MTPARTLDVLLDIDGVLYPFPELFTPYVAGELGRDLVLDTTHWAFYEQWGVDYDGFVDLVARGVAEGRLWWEGAPYEDVPAAVDRLRAAGHRLHLVTARDITDADVAMAATNHWIDEHDLLVESVNLAQDKPTVLAALGLEPAGCVAVDDGPQHVEAWHRAGVFAVVLDRWGSYRGDLLAVPDLTAFADLLEARLRDGF
ncbi:MAG: HAD family hydrolase [Ilumatobacteraceae bacterium]